MTVLVTGEIWYWKGPAPHYFVTVPEAETQVLKDIQGMVTYGWGMIPATVTIGRTEWKTALFPKDGRFIVPIKAVSRKAEKLVEGQTVTLTLDIAISVS